MITRSGFKRNYFEYQKGNSSKDRKKFKFQQSNIKKKIKAWSPELYTCQKQNIQEFSLENSYIFSNLNSKEKHSTLDGISTNFTSTVILPQSFSAESIDSSISQLQAKAHPNQNSQNFNSETTDGKDRSKDAGHYEFQVGECIKGYKIIEFISDGTFGRVVKIQHVKSGEIFAMKIIRAVKRYVEAAKSEAKMIRYLQKKIDIEFKRQKSNKIKSSQFLYTNKKFNYICNLVSAFPYQQNYCFVFEKLGKSLYEFLKANKYQGYPIDNIQSIFKQLLEAIALMHKFKVSHTDLKVIIILFNKLYQLFLQPENILLINDEYEQYLKVSQNNNQDIETIELIKPYSNKNTRKQMKKQQQLQSHRYYVPIDDSIKLIDFGGATHEKEHHSSIIQTRQYRAPEVLLGNCWDTKCDVWSIACIILELYTGDVYFNTHNDYEHIAMIEKVCGHIPIQMIKQISSKSGVSKYFDLKNPNSSDIYQRTKSDISDFQDITQYNFKTYFQFPQMSSNNDIIESVYDMQLICQVISKDYPELIDLLSLLLKVDPNQRLSCEEALCHEFFQISYN